MSAESILARGPQSHAHPQSLVDCLNIWILVSCLFHPHVSIAQCQYAADGPDLQLDLGEGVGWMEDVNDRAAVAPADGAWLVRRRLCMQNNILIGDCSLLRRSLFAQCPNMKSLIFIVHSRPNCMSDCVSIRHDIQQSLKRMHKISHQEQCIMGKPLTILEIAGAVDERG